MSQSNIIKERLELLVFPEHKELFRSVARERGMSLAGWVYQACLAYAKSNQGKTAKLGEQNRRRDDKVYWPSGWKKSVRCMDCMAFHDPQEAHPEFYPNGYSESQKETGEVFR